MSPGSEGVPALPLDTRLGQKAAGGAPSSASLDLSPNPGFILRQTHTARRLNPVAFDRRIRVPVPSSPPENADPVCRMRRANRKHPCRELATGQGKIRTPPYTPTRARDVEEQPPGIRQFRWSFPAAFAARALVAVPRQRRRKRGLPLSRRVGHLNGSFYDTVGWPSVKTVQSPCPQRAAVVARAHTRAKQGEAVGHKPGSRSSAGRRHGTAADERLLEGLRAWAPPDGMRSVSDVAIRTLHNAGRSVCSHMIKVLARKLRPLPVGHGQTAS